MKPSSEDSQKTIAMRRLVILDKKFLYKIRNPDEFMLLVASFDWEVVQEAYQAQHDDVSRRASAKLSYDVAERLLCYIDVSGELGLKYSS